MSIPIQHRQKEKRSIWDLERRTSPILKRGRYKDKQKAKLYSDLHLLLSSGLDIKTILEIQIDQAAKDWERSVLSKVLNEIISGSTLAESLLKWDIAGNYEYYSLKIGEESGNIVDVLFEIKRYFERKINQKRKVTSALTYPILVLITAIVAVGFMLNVIVPMFEEVFTRFQGDLPPLTQRIIDLSEWMTKNGLLLVLILIVFIILIRAIRKKLWYQTVLHMLILKTPVFGKLRRDIESARFCHIMNLLTAAKSPLVQSLNMVSEMIQFIPLKSAITKASVGISKGGTLHISLEESDYFERKFTSLIKAAEEVNKLDYAFNQLNEQYNQEIDHQLSILSSLMEPLLIVFVGGIVAVILIAMYLPLFQIGTSIY